ncbi:MAG TPA: phospholipase D-like domain-containing protein [Candidatus Saccharimonadales bacterium]
MHRKDGLHLTDSGYKDTLIDVIDQTSTRLLLEAMNIDHVGDMHDVLEATLRARKRGAEVLLVYDGYSYPTALLKHGPHGVVKLRNHLKDLERAGASLHQVGGLEANPFAGRHHAKAVVADNTVFVGGGANLTHDTFKTKDFMLRFESKALADILFADLPKSARVRIADDTLYAHNGDELLLDSGNKNTSLIYDRTCELADKAEKVWFVSKLAPDGRLFEILDSKDTKYWYNTLASASFFDSVAISIDQNRQNLDNLYKGSQEIHAKFCVFELSDGTYEVITGSHNFNSRGVKFGTQEIALHSKDQLLAKELLDFAYSLNDVKNAAS